MPIKRERERETELEGEEQICTVHVLYNTNSVNVERGHTKPLDLRQGDAKPSGFRAD